MAYTSQSIEIKDGAGATKYQTGWRDSVSGEIIPVATLPDGDFKSNHWSYAAGAGGIANTTTAVTIKGAAGANIRNYVTSIQVGADSLTNATELVIRDGAGGAVLWRHKIHATLQVIGFSVVFERPLKGSTNTLLEVATLTASGAGGVYFNAQGYSAQAFA
jgi:hypothetical protein